jgi:hypothetical protein
MTEIHKNKNSGGNMENRKRKARVTHWESDGEYISVRFTREDGQRVQAAYRRIGWESPPRDVMDKVLKALASGPKYWAGRRG